MGIAISIEIFQDTDDNLFRWVFLDSSGQKHGPSVGFTQCSAARADIDRVLATSLDASYTFNEKGDPNGR